jgi:D-alanine transaminase
MSRIVYVNGEYVPEADAKVSVFDRGFLFADAVYEVSSVLGSQLVDNAAHLARLQRSLGELKIDAPVSMPAIEAIQKELIQRNELVEGSIYLQISRGSADRDFAFPKNATPTLVMFTQARNIIDSPAAKRGISVMTVPDIRWGRRDIKTVQLLAASMAKQAAISAGFDDAWVVDGDIVNEASSANAYIVDDAGTIITRHLGTEILHGITRAAVLKLCAEHNIKIEQREFTIEEAYAAREAFITSASSFVYPVVRINERILSNGAPGPVATKLREYYIEAALAAQT